jgi:hypothetical protein
LQQIYLDYKDEGLMVLAIGLEMNQTQCQNWINSYNITHPVLSDMSLAVWAQFGMGFVPHNAVMNCADVITFTNYGFNETQIRNLVTSALVDVIQFDHEPFEDEVDPMTPVTITAEIESNDAFAAGFPKVFYRVDGGLWLSIEMNHDGGNSYSADLPGQSGGNTVDYFLRAEKTTGCGRPYPAKHQFWTYTVASDCINHGDANLDGILTAADAQLVFQFVIGGETPTFEQECAADCNGDEVISAADAQLVFLTVLGQETCVDPL